MFIVFNKQKIYSYLVALSTVVILFVIAFAVTNQSSDVVQTSTNIEECNNVVMNQSNNMYINQNNTIGTNQNSNQPSNQINIRENY